MYNTLSEDLKMKNILCSNQFRFRAKHSSYMALITLVDRLSKALKKSEIIIRLFPDFSKVFDNVDHEMLLCKLEHNVITGSWLDWFKDLFTQQMSICNPKQHFPTTQISKIWRTTRIHPWSFTLLDLYQ